VSVRSCGMRSMYVLGVVALGGACSDATAPPVRHVRVNPAWVSGEALAALDPSSGQFRLADPQASHVQRLSAETLAVAVARFYGDANTSGNAREVLEQDRGGPIDFNHLMPCSRAIYAASPLGEFPPPAPGWLRRAWGPQWAIALCGHDGGAQLSVGVPDNPMDVRVVDGRIVFRQSGGGSNFNAAGVPARFSLGLPLTPEEAVAEVFAQTMRRTVLVPFPMDQHDANGVGQLPLCASWRIEIEAAVTVRSETDQRTLEAKEFFVRRWPACFSDSIALYVAAPVQPSARWFAFPKDTTSIATVDLDSVQVAVIRPIAFERVSVIR
jgi:hypothetical protein